MPPYLLIHGDKDLTVPFEQSTRFQKQMQDLGNQCDLITIPEGVHGMGSWDKLNSNYREKLIAWLNVTLTEAPGPLIKRNIAYADPAHERQVLDVYSPREAKNLPVVFWIHGGGWQAGDKTSVQLKPQVFVDKGFVFVSTNWAGSTDTSPSTAAIRNASSSWVIPPGRSSRRWSARTTGI